MLLQNKINSLFDHLTLMGKMILRTLFLLFSLAPVINNEFILITEFVLYSFVLVTKLHNTQ